MSFIAQAAMESVSRFTDDHKRRDLKNVTVGLNSESGLTTDHGVKVPDTDNWYIYPQNHFL
jgi:catalase